jgi:hypothetical protein
VKARPKPPGGFSTMPVRLAGELDDRLQAAERGIQLHNPYLDDRLRMILPHDLVIFTSRSGAGKTQSVLSVAVENARHDRRVGIFALEAEPRELERRAKYQWLALEAWGMRLPGIERMNYTDWLLGRCEDIIGDLNQQADEWFLNNLSQLWTYYKGHGRFSAEKMDQEIQEISPLVDLVILDHLHYVDGKEGESENKSLTRIAHTLRDCALALGKPVIAVAHLRKQFGQRATLMPDQEEIMGPSDIFKVTTQIVAFAPARFVDPPKWWLAPTLISVVKDRREGNDNLAALTWYDTRSRTYADHYTLGRLTKGCTEWEQLSPADIPRWAIRHRQIEIEMTKPDAVDNSPAPAAKSAAVDFGKRLKKATGEASNGTQPELSSDQEWSARFGNDPGWDGGHK